MSEDTDTEPLRGPLGDPPPPEPSDPEAFPIPAPEPEWVPAEEPGVLDRVRRALAPGDEIPTYEVTLPPNVVGDANSTRAAHWLMAQGRVLELQGAHSEIYVMKDVWLTPDYAASGGGWYGVNLHNSSHDVGNTGAGGIGWGFGNGVSCLAWNLDSPGADRTNEMFSLHLEQVIDSANGGAARDWDLAPWPRGRWVSVAAWIRFGRSDGSTAKRGAVKAWLDGKQVIDLPEVTILQRAKNPANGQTYVQTIGEFWEGGPYLLFAGRSTVPTFVSRQTLARLAPTLQGAYDDRPVLEREWGSVYLPNTATVAPKSQWSSSRRLTGAEARKVSDFILPAEWRSQISDGGNPPVAYTVAQTVADGQSISGTATWLATTSDDANTASVAFSVDGSVVHTETSPPFGNGEPPNTDAGVWDSRKYPDGTHTLSVEAIHRDGRVTSASAKVTIDNVEDPPDPPDDTLAATVAHLSDLITFLDRRVAALEDTLARISAAIDA